MYVRISQFQPRPTTPSPGPLDNLQKRFFSISYLGKQGQRSRSMLFKPLQFIAKKLATSDRKVLNQMAEMECKGVK